ncbi:hypothetical protein [Virgibacillus ndiopensis]|uniref:hypothetical protein n=1 Tax=Virgibacillus ndiopensis TaxID=2004408 RepID=UPI000C07838E|nr:hypothetical protein [Virgibacillus ndiopensis]
MDTEGIAVDALKQNIRFNPLLKGYEINENDKTPSWDGEIFVYHKLGKNKSYKKSNLDGKVPIQVKGKEVKKLQGDSIKYRLHKDDLNNYYKDGGAIFFVVEFTDPLNTKIYYASLLPFDLKQILKEMGIKKSINYEFASLPTGGQSLTALCRMFLINSRKQSHNVMDKAISFNDKKPGRLRFVVPADMDPRDALLNYDIYMYQPADLKIDETTTSIDIPVQRGKITSLIECTGVTIGINNEVVYADVSRKLENDRKTLRFGRSFQLDIKDLEDARTQKVNINFKEGGTFGERLKDCQFMLHITKQKELEINGHVLELNHNHTELIEELPEHIDSLKETIQVFKKLNASFDVPIVEISEEDYRRIEILKRIFLNDNYSDLHVKNDGFIKMDIANRNFLLFAYHDTNQEVIILNGCDWKTLSEHVEFLVQEEGGEQKGTISPYVCNKVDDLIAMANFNLEDVKSSYLSIDYNSDVAKSKANLHLLEFLAHYDQQTDKNEDILLMLEEVFQYIRSFEKSDDHYYINQMQVVKRMREFTSEEKEEILLRKNDSEDTFILCGYLLLMDNEMEFDIHFDKLTQKEKESFKDFPIYNLINII